MSRGYTPSDIPEQDEEAFKKAFEREVGMLGALLHTPEADTSDEGTAALLEHDPLGTLDDLHARSGGSYLNAPPSHMFAYAGVHNARKEAVLKERGDTTMTNALDDYQAIITAYGFELALEFPFRSRSWDKAETYFIYTHPELGLVLSFDTYNTDSVNGGKVYYNWKPHDGVRACWPMTSSGGWHDYDNDPVWVGDHDCREALIFRMERLRKNGTFLPKWRANPFLWFLNHDDTHNVPYEAARAEWLKTDRSTPAPRDIDFPEGKYDYDAINRERIAMAPKVQAIIQPYKEPINA